jgi:hypothetical protein
MEVQVSLFPSVSIREIRGKTLLPGLSLIRIFRGKENLQLLWFGRKRAQGTQRKAPMLEFQFFNFLCVLCDLSRLIDLT